MHISEGENKNISYGKRQKENPVRNNSLISIQVSDLGLSVRVSNGSEFLVKIGEIVGKLHDMKTTLKRVGSRLLGHRSYIHSDKHLDLSFVFCHCECLICTLHYYVTILIPALQLFP